MTVAHVIEGVVASLVGGFCLLAAGSLVFLWIRTANGVIIIFSAIPVILLGMFGYVILRHAWRRFRRELPPGS